MGDLYEIRGDGTVDFQGKGTEELVIEQGTSDPVSGSLGQIFYRTDTKELKIYDGATFVSPPAAGSASVALDNLSGVSINTSLISDTDVTDDLGSAGIMWNNIYGSSINVGSDAKAGLLNIFPSSSGKGSLRLSSVDSVGNYIVDVVNASHAAARVYTLDDMGANASFAMTTGTQTIGGEKTFLSANGTSGAPTHSFSNATSLGMYRVSASTLGFSAGSLKLSLTSTRFISSVQITVPDGSISSPGLTFSSSTNTGVYLSNIGEMSVSAGGGQRLRIGSSSMSALVPVLLSNGSVSSPSLSFTSDDNTGIYWQTANQFGLVTDGVNRLTISTLAIAPQVPVRTLAGTVGVPSYSFSTDNNSGMYSIANNSVGFSSDGVLKLAITSSDIQASVPISVPDGSVSAPSLQFTGTSANTGIYLEGTDSIGFSIDGSGSISFNSTAATFSMEIRGPAGNATSPGYTFSTDDNSGMYSITNNTIGFSADGVLKLSISTLSIDPQVAIRVVAGTVGVPSYSFSTDNNSGMYSISNNILGFSADGDLKLSISTSSITSTLPIRAVTGSVGTPSYSFSDDDDTGFYSKSGNGIGFAFGGGLKITFADGIEINTGTLAVPSGSSSAPSVTVGGNDVGLYKVATDTLGISTGSNPLGEFDANGLLIKKAAGHCAVQNITNNGVYNGVSGPTNVSVADNGSFTFTLQQGGLFTVINANNERCGVFVADFNGVVRVIDDSGSHFTGTDTDNGDNIAVFKSASSTVVTVKNYTGLSKNIRVSVVGNVISATAVV